MWKRRVVTLALCGMTAQAQDLPCPDQGSDPMAGVTEAGPPLGCIGDPGAPAWWLWTPSHHRVVPRAGYRQGEARIEPRVLLTVRCTGFPLAPVEVVSLSAHGYVFDIRQVACGTAVPNRATTDL